MIPARPLLGAIVGSAGAVPPGLDLIVVPVGSYMASRWSTSPGVSVLVRTDDAGEAAMVLAAGAAGIVVGTSSEELRAAADGSLLVALDDRSVAVVDSADAARAAFARGASVVLYDLPAVLAGLASVRPGAVPSGEPVVLLSGMLGDEHLWDDVDVPTPWPLRIDLDDSIAELAESVLAAAPPRFAVVAHSLGAIVALEVQRRAPTRVTRLALLNSSARGAEPTQLAAWSRLAERVRGGEFDVIVRELAEATLASESTDLVDRNAAMGRAVGPAGFLRQLAAQATRPDSRDRLAAVDVPVLVVSGSADSICPPERQEELAAALPCARLVTIEGGHMLPLEAPVQVSAALREWWDA